MCGEATVQEMDGHLASLAGHASGTAFAARKHNSTGPPKKETYSNNVFEKMQIYAILHVLCCLFYVVLFFFEIPSNTVKLSSVSCSPPFITQGNSGYLTGGHLVGAHRLGISWGKKYPKMNETAPKTKQNVTSINSMTFQSAYFQMFRNMLQVALWPFSTSLTPNQTIHILWNPLDSWMALTHRPTFMKPLESHSPHTFTDT